MSIQDKIESHLLHTPPMFLLDKIEWIDLNLPKITTSTTLKKEAVYFDQKGAYKSYWNIELMAQATAILFNKLNKSDSPSLGFLVAVDNYFCQKNEVNPKINDIMEISSQNQIILNPFGIYQCEIHLNKSIYCTAELKCMASGEKI